MKSYIKTKKIIFLILIVSLFFSTIISYNLESNVKNNNKQLKISKTSIRIHIIGNSGWLDFKNDGNCTGEGTSSSPYVIEDLVIDGEGSGSCIQIEDSTVYFKINNCTVYNSSGYQGGYHAGGIRLVNTSFGELTNNNCSSHIRGIYLSSSSYNVISGNYMTNATGSGILLFESNLNLISGNTANDNEVGISIHTSTSNSVSGNTLNNNKLVGISLHFNFVNSIRSNTVSSCSKGISFYGCNRSYVFGNMLNHNTDGILMNDSFNNNILGNKINYNSDNGIYLEFSNYNYVSRNIVNNNGNGIYLFNSDNNTVSENTADINRYCGIHLDNSNINTISGNTANNNENDGICIFRSFNNEITRNIANNNTYGFDISQSDNNNLYLNNLVNNFLNVYSYNSTNRWNSQKKILYIYKGKTYTTYLGNYWDNYTGNDANNDGIGDTPFIIGGVIDNYPLMEPIENYEIIEMLEVSGGGIPFDLIFLISSISGWVVIGVATLLLIIRKRKRIQ